MLVVVLGLYVQQALAYFGVRRGADHQQAIVRQLEREHARLVREQSTLRDPATIERDARALGMVQASERPYVVAGLPNR